MVIRLFLADDHVVLREGVAALLGAESDIEIVGQAGTADAAVRGCLESQADVAVMDLTMPGGGLEAIRQLRAVDSKVRCIVLTMHDDPAYMRAVLDAGGAGYLVKGAATDELTDAVRKVAAGATYIKVGLSPVEHRSAGAFAGPDPLAQLSRRERQVFILLARGYGNREIAQKLGVKTKTIDTYRARVQDKLGLTSRAEIVDYALKAGLLTPDSDDSTE